MKTKQLFTKVYLICFLFMLTACGASREEIAATMAVQTIEARGTETANVEQAVSNALTQTVPTLTPIPPTSTPEIEGMHTPAPEAVTLLEQALSYSQQGDDKKALEIYTKAIEVDPLYAQAYINRCSVYARNGEPEKGLADCNRGLELEPDNVMGYSNRSQANIDLENFDAALDDIGTILGLTDDEEYIKYSIFRAGRIFDERGETGLALAAYSTVLEIDEFFEYALFTRGQIYLQQEDRLRAFSDLVLLLELTEEAGLSEATFDILEGVYPEGTTFEDAIAASKEYSVQAAQYSEAENYENSIEAWAKAIEIDPLNSEFYLQRSLDLANNGELEKAIADMGYAIALNPTDLRGYYWRGMMEADNSMPAEAIADLEKALKFDLSADTEANAKQVLDNMYKSLETCQFTEFEVLNDTENPTFAFIFEGPPGEPVITSIFPYPVGDKEGTVSFAMVPENGVVPMGTEYKLKEDESAPIDIKIDVFYPGCRLRKIVTWPEIDILALLSEGAITTEVSAQPDANEPQLPAIVADHLENPRIIRVDTFETGGAWDLSYTGKVEDGVLVYVGEGSSGVGVNRNGLFSKGSGILINFKSTTNGQRFMGVDFDQGQWNKSSWRRFGIEFIDTKGVQSHLAIGNEYNNQALHGNLNLVSDKWYSLLLAIGKDGKFLAVIWDPSNPDNFLWDIQMMNKSTKPTWTFNLGGSKGTFLFDDFVEIKFDDILTTP